jgi:hypothetical protein
MAVMRVYWVQLRHGNGDNARSFSLPFECGFDSVAGLAAHISEHGIVSGNKLGLTDDGRGGKLITGRWGFAFGATGLVTIQDYFRPVWEPDDTGEGSGTSREAVRP